MVVYRGYGRILGRFYNFIVSYFMVEFRFCFDVRQVLGDKDIMGNTNTSKRENTEICYVSIGATRQSTATNDNQWRQVTREAIGTTMGNTSSIRNTRHSSVEPPLPYEISESPFEMIQSPSAPFPSSFECSSNTLYPHLHTEDTNNSLGDPLLTRTHFVVNSTRRQVVPHSNENSDSCIPTKLQFNVEEHCDGSKSKPKLLSSNNNLPEKGNIKTVDYEYLLALSVKGNTYIIEEIKQNEKSFERVFEGTISPPLMVILMKLVKKVCASDNFDYKIEILKIICCDNFFKILGTYITDLPTHEKDSAEEDKLFLVECVIPFFEISLSLIPHIVGSKLRDLFIKTTLCVDGMKRFQNVEIDNNTMKRISIMECIVLNKTPQSNKNGVESKPSQYNTSYGGTRKTGVNKISDLLNINILHGTKIRGMQSNLFFVDRSYSDEETKKYGEFLIGLALYLNKQQYDAKDIALLTTNELDLQILLALKGRFKVLEKMTTKVMEDNENVKASIILMCLASNLVAGPSLYSRNILHKAFSGAKEGIFMIGNMNELEQLSPTWSALKLALYKYKAIAPHLSLCCLTHQTISIINDAQDFKTYRNGGCNMVCKMKLACGHECVRRCHTDDLEHNDYVCHKPCTRIPDNCTRKHTCRKLCHEICGLCITPLTISGVTRMCHQVTQPDQNITQNITAYQTVRNLPPNPSHVQEGSVHRQYEKVQNYGNNQKGSVELPCGHISSSNLPPFKKLNEWSLELKNVCHVPCSTMLECGHPCSGTCGICHQGKVHFPCQEKRKMRLACGHRVVVECKVTVAECEQKCFFQCSHIMCRQKCNTPCTPCSAPCASSCMHSKCSKLCSELCDRKPCTKPCQNILHCGHQCIGFCGEPCPPGPENCRECNPEKFKRWDSSGTVRFVLLEDCGHVVRATDLDRRSFNKSSKLEALECPICGYSVTKTGRYLSYNKELHRNLFLIRYNYDEYRKNNMKSMLGDIISEIRAYSLPKEIDNCPRIQHIKKKLKSAVTLSDIDQKLMILLHFVRNIVCSVGSAPYNPLHWMLDLLMERYENGFSKQVLKELYKMVLVFQGVSGSVHKDKILQLHLAISYSHLLEKNTWFKCQKGHLTTYNALVASCPSCHGV